MMSDIGSSERMERKTVVSEFEMTLLDELYYQDCIRCDSVGESILDLLFRDSTMIYYKMSMRSWNKIVNECLDNASIGTTITKDVTENSNTRDNLEDMDY